MADDAVGWWMGMVRRGSCTFAMCTLYCQEEVGFIRKLFVGQYGVIRSTHAGATGLGHTSHIGSYDSRGS
jgi:hypothetical protein